MAAVSCSAASRAFAVPELLEQILTDIGDMKTLLLAQRVGKNWHSGINESSKLRKMLFFDRDPDCIDAIRCWAYDMPETGNHCSKCNNNYQYLNLLIAWTGRGQQDWKTYKPVQVTLDVLALPSYVSAMKMYVSAIPVARSYNTSVVRPIMFGNTACQRDCALHWFFWRQDQTVGDLVVHTLEGCGGHDETCHLRKPKQSCRCFAIADKARSWLAPRYTADEPAMLIEPDGMF